MSTVLTDPLHRLAQVAPSQAPVISVYVCTRAHDEHQRGRVRVFLKNERRRVAAMAAGATEADLAWITEQGERIVSQELYPEAESVAMFAGGSPVLRESIPLAVPVEDTLAVADTPRLRPLVAALAGTPRALVVFVDAERARLITLGDDGGTEEILLEHPDVVVGHHRRGGFALLLQSKYDKHMRVHRDRHFDAVAEALATTVARFGTTAIVLAGEPRARAVFRPYLSPAVAEAIVGEVAGTQYEPAATLAARAREVIRLVAGSEQAMSTDVVLVAAGAGGRAAAGMEATLEAVNRGTVDRLYLLDAFADAGATCGTCAALQHGAPGACRWCGKPTKATDLGEAMVQRVLAAGGSVEAVRVHGGLAREGGVAALLRYAPVVPGVAR
jgi:protein required for attachment to host cells